jgi:peroxiredoxin
MLGIGDLAIDFDLPSSDGKSIKLSERVKKHAPLLLIFYKYDCPTCQFTFRFLPGLAHQLGAEHFLPIAQDSRKEAEKFKATYKYDFDIACDEKPYLVSAKYGLTFVPTFFVVERDMKISQVGEGFDKKLLEEFSNRIAQVKGVGGFQAFQPTDQVPLLKPG